MTFAPDSESTALSEFNTCHEPGGKPSGGQFCSKDEAVAAAGVAKPTKSLDEDREGWNTYFDAERAVRKGWERGIKRGISHGKLSYAQAYKLGFYPSGHVDERRGYETLPSELFHVSTGAEGILRQGLKSREELAMTSARGLGGGDDDTVSFTDSLETARAIQKAMFEARAVARGEKTLRMMVDEMQRSPLQGVDANGPIGTRTWYEAAISFHVGRIWKEGDTVPLSLELALKGETALGYEEEKTFPVMVEVSKLPDGYRAYQTHTRPDGVEMVHRSWIVRPQTEDEKREFAFGFYKNFSVARQYAGGRLDPLFFGTDWRALANTPKRDIRIMRFKPRTPKAQGYRVNSLGEWRVYSGSAVRFDGIAESVAGRQG